MVAKRIKGEDWQREREQAFKDWARTENEARNVLKRLEMDRNNQRSLNEAGKEVPKDVEKRQ